jgi:hypothetical protein
MPMQRGKPRRAMHHIDAGHCHTCRRAAKAEHAVIEDVTADYSLVHHFCSRQHRDVFLHYGGRHVRPYHA